MRAKYIYADVNRYSEHALQTIRERFERDMSAEGISADHVRLLYNRSVDCFYLACPSEHGTTLDNLMQVVLGDFRDKQESHTEVCLLPHHTRDN